MEIGLDCYHRKEYQVAIEAFDRFLLNKPTNEAIINFKGLSHEHLSEFERAFYCFERVLELNTNNYLALYSIANLNRKLERFSKAVDYYNRAIQIKPNAIALNNSGYCSCRLDDFTQALNSYTKAVELLPKNSFAHYNTAKVSKILGDLSIAFDHFHSAIELSSMSDSRLPLTQLKSACRNLSNCSSFTKVSSFYL